MAFGVVLRKATGGEKRKRERMDEMILRKYVYVCSLVAQCACACVRNALNYHAIAFDGEFLEDSERSKRERFPRVKQRICV